MPDLLLELLSEEIPARMQARAAADLKRLVTEGLVEAGLTYAAAGAYVTPRRLALSVEGLTAASPATREERKGPRADAPEKAVEGFLRSSGLERDQLELRDDKKGQVYFAVIERAGRPAAEIVAEVVPEVIRSFPWPKSMRWGAGSLRWVRPLHSILCILTDEAGAGIVPFEVDGIASGDSTAGHPFMAPGRFSVTSAEDYELGLMRAHVILNSETRAEKIWHEAEQLAFAQGLELVEDKGLLAEVAGLVEWPVVLMGPIGEDFLDLPPEVLRTSMKEHQKFFSVKNPKSGRIENFITVANRETADHGAAILAGNARVLTARLADAKFFWENDLRVARAQGLEDGGMAAPLEAVTFHAKLGSQAERVRRIEALAREIAPLVGAKPDLAAEAARVAKADLASQMVYEFPELQGVMGKYYARAAGHDDGVPEACEEHYAPLGPSDAVPTAPVSVAVALADKIDMLTGFWAIDEKPTGSKDRFALRRAALGVIRIVLSGNVRLALLEILSEHITQITSDLLRNEEIWKAVAVQYASEFISEEELERRYDGGDRRASGIALAERFICRFADEEFASDAPGNIAALQELWSMAVAEPDEWSWSFAETIKAFEAEGGFEEYWSPSQNDHFRFIVRTIRGITGDLLSFLADRLKVHLRAEGVRHDVIDACFRLGGQDDLVLLVNRVRALQAFLGTEDGANLLTGYKRANNILNVEEKKDGVEYSMDPDPKFAEEEAEKALFAALDAAEAAIAPALDAEDFEAAMRAMAAVRAPIDAFFDHVTVNAENAVLRRNRLCLLNRIRAVMNRVAIFAAIEG